MLYEDTTYSSTTYCFNTVALHRNRGDSSTIPLLQAKLDHANVDPKKKPCRTSFDSGAY